MTRVEVERVRRLTLLRGSSADRARPRCGEGNKLIWADLLSVAPPTKHNPIDVGGPVGRAVRIHELRDDPRDSFRNSGRVAVGPVTGGLCSGLLLTCRIVNSFRNESSTGARTLHCMKLIAAPRDDFSKAYGD